MSETPPRPHAVLVSVQLPDVSDEEHAGNLAELVRLVDTLGYEVVAEDSQRREMLSKSLVLGEGKLRELAAVTGGRGYVPSPAPQKKDKARVRRGEIDGDDDEALELDDDDDTSDPDRPGKPKFVIVDHDLTPSQARHLEAATGASVLDRTGVIIEIFHRHARSRVDRLQVELARLVSGLESPSTPRSRLNSSEETRSKRVSIRLSVTTKSQSPRGFAFLYRILRSHHESSALVGRSGWSVDGGRLERAQHGGRQVPARKVEGGVEGDPVGGGVLRAF